LSQSGLIILMRLTRISRLLEKHFGDEIFIKSSQRACPIDCNNSWSKRRTGYAINSKRRQE